MKQWLKKHWLWLVATLLGAFIVSQLVSCALMRAPRDLNRDGVISKKEALEPAVSTVKSGIDVATGGMSEPITDFLYDLLYPAGAAAGAYTLSKKGSKRRHSEQENRWKEENRELKKDVAELKEIIVKMGKGMS